MSKEDLKRYLDKVIPIQLRLIITAFLIGMGCGYGLSNEKVKIEQARIELLKDQIENHKSQIDQLNQNIEAIGFAKNNTPLFLGDRDKTFDYRMRLMKSLKVGLVRCRDDLINDFKFDAISARRIGQCLESYTLGFRAGLSTLEKGGMHDYEEKRCAAYLTIIESIEKDIVNELLSVTPQDSKKTVAQKVFIEKASIMIEQVDTQISLDCKKRNGNISL